MIKLLTTYAFFGLVPAAISLTATCLLTHTLSPSTYGMGMLLTASLQLVAMLCISGMERVFLRHYYEKEYQYKTHFLLYCCLMLVGINTFFFLIVALFVSPFFDKVPFLNNRLFIVLITIGALTYILEIFTSLIPRIQKKASIYTLGQIVQQSAFLISIIFFIILWKKNSLVILYGQMIGLGACSATLIYIFRKEWQFPKKYFRELKFDDIKTFISYGYPFVFSASLAWLYYNADKFLLLKWSNASELGIYTAAFVLACPLDAMRSAFNLAWKPRCNQLITETPFKGKKIFHSTFHQLLWAFTVVASVLLLLSSSLVLFLGEQFRGAEHVFGWLLLSVYFFGLSDIVMAGILKSGKTYWNVGISVVSLLVNVVTCYHFIPRYGAQGAAFANALSLAIFFLLEYIVGFFYYPFKIIRWKLILYVTYLCSMIMLCNRHHFYLQFISAISFFIASAFLERKWLFPYFRQLISFFKKALSEKYSVVKI